MPSWWQLNASWVFLGTHSRQHFQWHGSKITHSTDGVANYHWNLQHLPQLFEGSCGAQQAIASLVYISWCASLPVWKVVACFMLGLIRHHLKVVAGERS